MKLRIKFEVGAFSFCCSQIYSIVITVRLSLNVEHRDLKLTVLNLTIYYNEEWLHIYIGRDTYPIQIKY